MGWAFFARLFGANSHRGHYDRDIRTLLRQNGCERRGGQDGETWFSPISQRTFLLAGPICSPDLANKILANAGLPPVFDN